MPRLSQEVTTTTKQVVKLKPSLKSKLVKQLKTYLNIKDQEKVIKQALKRGRGDIEDTMEEAGQSSLDVDGIRATIVAPVRKVFNPKKFVALGGNLEHYNGALDEVPGTPWVKVSKAGVKDEDDDAE